MLASPAEPLAELGIDETAPSITGRYSVGQTLGEGRFSQVVAATCVRTGADVALKAMAIAEVTDDKEAREMLAQEVAVLRRASGREGIVGLREVLATPDTLYLVLERVHGCELFDAISDAASAPGGAMAASLVRPLLAQLFAALAALQELGCTHRDVKPDNIMVSGLDAPQVRRPVISGEW